MTAFDYSRLRGTASRLIARFGKPATLTRRVPGTGNSWDADATSDRDVPFPVTVVEDKTATRYSRDPAGALIPRTVRVLLISAAGEAPRMGDKITLASGTHEIARVAPVQPGGEALLYEAEIAQ